MDLSLNLDLVVVAVAGQPWQKSGAGAPVASPSQRLAMARAAFEGCSNGVPVDVDASEVSRDGPTYTIDTVERLQAGSDTEIVLVLGADAAAGLPTWHRAGDLATRVTVAVVPRPGGELPALVGWRVIEVAMDPVDLSSTEIRRRLAGGEAPDRLGLPDGVADLISRGRIYSA